MADTVVIAAANDAWPLGLVPEREREDRYLGYDVEAIDELAAAGVADRVLVKADGARSRLLKAPADHEPQLPESTDVVIPIASVRAVGKPLVDRHVHRPERVAAITGRPVGEPIEPIDVARVLASADGGLAGVPAGATVVPLLNAVDDERLCEVAERIAREILALADGVERVVLARMLEADPVIAVVR